LRQRWRAWAVPAPEELAGLFLRANTERHLVGISVGIGSNRRRKLFQIQLVMVLGDCRPGHQIENINNNNELRCWFASIFSVEFLRRLENTRKNPLQPFVLLAFLLVSEEQTFSANFHYSERKN
jgi:hypothetical protein